MKECWWMRDLSFADDRAIICLSLGSFLLLFGATSYIIRGKFFLSTAVVALIFGESLGQKVLAQLQESHWGRKEPSK